MPDTHTLEIRVRYHETDPMGRFYNARVLEWFEAGRTELLRARGMSYAEVEQRGILLPMTESHVVFTNPATYDDLLHLTTHVAFAGKARLRFDVRIDHPDGTKVAEGYTIHAVVDPAGKPVRPPGWFSELINGGAPA